MELEQKGISAYLAELIGTSEANVRQLHTAHDCSSRDARLRPPTLGFWGSLNGPSLEQLWLVTIVGRQVISYDKSAPNVVRHTVR